MRRRAVLMLVMIVLLALWTWRSQLFTVSRPGERPRALETRVETGRAPAALDVVLPVVPVGMERLQSGERVLLIHYWAPWERHGAAQAATLDSLSRLAELEPLRVALVCFDPYPSVARYVGRHRLRVRVLLDSESLLRRALPCPSVPYTYVLDRSGRVAIAQAGEVDWLADGTRSALEALLRERDGRVAPTASRRDERNPYRKGPASMLHTRTSEGGLELTIFRTAPSSPLVPDFAIEDVRRFRASWSFATLALAGSRRARGRSLY